MDAGRHAEEEDGHGHGRSRSDDRYDSPQRGESELNPASQSPVQVFSRTAKSRMVEVVAMAGRHVDIPHGLASSPAFGGAGSGLRDLKEENAALMDMISRLNDHFARLKAEAARDASAWAKERESLHAAQHKTGAVELDCELLRQEKSAAEQKLAGMQEEVRLFPPLFWEIHNRNLPSPGRVLAEDFEKSSCC
jgi:hypothetical protein